MCCIFLKWGSIQKYVFSPSVWYNTIWSCTTSLCTTCRLKVRTSQGGKGVLLNGFSRKEDARKLMAWITQKKSTDKRGVCDWLIDWLFPIPVQASNSSVMMFPRVPFSWGAALRGFWGLWEGRVVGRPYVLTPQNSQVVQAYIGMMKHKMSLLFSFLAPFPEGYGSCKETPTS